MTGLYIALGLVALIALGQGLTVVAFLFAADAENHAEARTEAGDA